MVTVILKLLRPGSAVARICALAVIALAAYASLKPNIVVPDAVPDHSDLIVHVVMHSAVAGMLCIAWPRHLPWVLAAALILAVGLEVGQIAVEGRSFDLLDLVANLVGLTLGALGARYLSRRYFPTPSTRP